MKLLKGLLFIVLFQTTTSLVAQEKDHEITVSVSEIIITADTFEEFETMDWDDLFTVFEDNAAKDSIRVGIRFEDLNLYKKDGDSVLVNALQVMVADISENKEEMKKQIQDNTSTIMKVLRKIKK
jgi:hypothetical protein